MNISDTELLDTSAATPTSSNLLAPVRSSVAANAIATLAVIAALWWGQRFLIPLAAGLMLAMLVMPLTVQMAGWLLSSVAATVLTLLRLHPRTWH
nr:hypothetical protein [Rhodoferax sp.]